ncbi:MAG: hypothetical protein FJ291_30815 [Planctomycetes bacterium]|nr:hypothetical protein [Planctomycetota bacterium]
MLEKLRLKNFKMHGDTELEPGLVTVLIGPQGTGKSTVLQALTLLNESAGKEGLSYLGSFAGMTFGDIVHRREERRLVSFHLDLSCLAAPPPLAWLGDYHVAYDIAVDNQGFHDHSAQFTFKEATWDVKGHRVGGKTTSSMPVDLVKCAPGVRFSASAYTLVPFSAVAETQDYALFSALEQVRLSVRDFVRRSHFVPEGRTLQGSTFRNLGPSDAVPRSVEQIVSRLAHEWELRDRVSAQLEAILQRRISFRAAGESIEVEAGGGVPVPVMAEGGGLRALVWPLGAMAVAGPGALVAIEEPEIHLHPKAVAALADVMLSVALGKGTQLLLTTHNEHLLFAFLLAVAQGRLPAQRLAIYTAAEEEGRAAFTRLTVTDKGAVEGGLRDFFEASSQGLEAHLKALMSRGSQR